MILPIGRWALDTACRQARAWQDGGLAPVSIAINVSAVELRGKDFLSNVRQILEQNRLEPRFLELELTETFMMQDWKSTAEILRALKSLGVRIALDDFGTGYSSLSYMKRFPIDALKIDQSFVRDMTTDCRRREHRERRHQHGPQLEHGRRRRGHPDPRSAPVLEGPRTARRDRDFTSRRRFRRQELTGLLVEGIVRSRSSRTPPDASKRAQPPEG